LGSRPGAGDRAPRPAATGRPLDPAVRAQLEAGFGREFGQVRVHTGEQAAASAAALGARAYTVGEDIVLGAGAAGLASPAGRRLLAHELAHVAQQRRGVRLPGGIDQVTDAYERHAQAVADQVVSGGSAAGLVSQGPSAPTSGGGQVVQRQPETEVAAIQACPRRRSSWPGTSEASPRTAENPT
jgi:hypothetical protein